MPLSIKALAPQCFFVLPIMFDKPGVCVILVIKKCIKKGQNMIFTNDASPAMVKLIKPYKQYLFLLENYIPAPDMDEINLIEDIKSILKQDQAGYIRWAIINCSDSLKKLINFSMGYNPSFDDTKFKQVIESVVKKAQAQKEFSKAELLNLSRQYLQKIKEQHQQNKRLKTKFFDLLEVLKLVLIRGKDKARLTAIKAKRDFDNTADSVQKIQSNKIEPENVNIKNLQDMAMGDLIYKNEISSCFHPCCEYGC